MSLYYPEKKKLTPDLVEAYVQGMWDLYLSLGADGHSKMYDPLTIEGNIAHSYVLDLDDGGRHHEFSSLERLKEQTLQEFTQMAEDNLLLASEQDDVKKWAEKEAKKQLKIYPLHGNK